MDTDSLTTSQETFQYEGQVGFEALHGACTVGVRFVGAPCNNLLGVVIELSYLNTGSSQNQQLLQLQTDLYKQCYYKPYSNMKDIKTLT